MSGSVTLTTLLLFAALLRRFFATRPALAGHGPAARVDRAIDGVVFAGTATLVGLGSWIAILGLVGAATPLWVGVGALVGAGLAWKRRPKPAPRTVEPGSLRAVLPHLIALTVLLGGLALRTPPIESQLAGRDQGSYTLRAQQLHATGSHEVHDPALEWAANEGAVDVLTLWPQTGTEDWRADRYEQGYRPGFYVADRETGRVVPQFLHLHPSVLALGAWLFGPSKLHLIMLLLSGLVLTAAWRVAAMVLSRHDLATIALAIFGVLPQAVWTHRMTLSEGLAGLLVLAAGLAWLRRGATATRDRWFGVACLVALAGVRGEAWLLVPCVLVAASMEGLPRLHALVGLAGVWLWVALHAGSSFPYVHDELVRLREAWRDLTPLGIAGGHALLMALAAGAVVAPHPKLARRAFALAPRLVLVVAVLMMARRALDNHPGPPFARLDPTLPVFGPLLCTLALGGLVFSWPAWTRRRDAQSIALSLAWIPALSALAFARTNLPAIHLYTYGRYLVPALLPGAILVAMGMLAMLAGPNEQGWSLRRVAAYGLGLGMVVPSLLAYLQTPEMRLDDHRGARRLVEALAEDTPRGAIILAGGEGPHARHAFNHVGGAIALSHGRTVVPFADDEQAYAAALRLRQRFDDVYVLHDAQAPAVELEGRWTVGVQPSLGPGLRAEVMGLYTLFTHRVTPTEGSIPDRVTRDALHLALLRVEPTDDDERLALPSCAQGERRLGAVEDVSWVSIELGPASAPGAVHWKVRARDGDASRPLHLTAAQGRKTPRTVLGPWAVAPGEAVTVRGNGACDAEATVLRHRPEPRETNLPTPVRLEPPRDLGHPVPQVIWREARGLGRLRRPLQRAPQLGQRGLRIDDEHPLEFAPALVPAGPTSLVLWIDDGQGTALEIETSRDARTWKRVARVEPTSAAWSSQPIPLPDEGPLLALRIRSEAGTASLRYAQVLSDP